MMASTILAARNCTTRATGHGLPRAASPPHDTITRLHCCPTARCWWRGDTMAGALLLAARDCTPLLAGVGVQPAIYTWHANFPRGRCCPPAMCWWPREEVPAFLLE